MREPRLLTEHGEIPFSELPTTDLRAIVRGEYPFIDHGGSEDSSYHFGVLYAKILLSERAS